MVGGGEMVECMDVYMGMRDDGDGGGRGGAEDDGDGGGPRTNGVARWGRRGNL